jgi:hypothetical protein
MKTMIVMLAAALLCSFPNDTAQAGNFPFGGRQAVVPASPAVARAVVADFNGDGYPDFVLQAASTHQTAIWYLNNNVHIGGAYGPTLPAGWGLAGVADFNGWGGRADYVLFAPNTRQTAIWYLSGPSRIASAYGPTLPSGWELVDVADWDFQPAYVLCNPGTGQTAVWHLYNNVFSWSEYGPTLLAGWRLVAVAGFYGSGTYGDNDYVLFNPVTGQTLIGYLSGTTLIKSAYGPTIPRGWALVATADFDGDYYPDYLLYNASSRQTAIWYLNDNVLVGSAFGPTLPAGWSLVGP